MKYWATLMGRGSEDTVSIHISVLAAEDYDSAMKTVETVMKNNPHEGFSDGGWECKEITAEQAAHILALNDPEPFAFNIKDLDGNT